MAKKRYIMSKVWEKASKVIVKEEKIIIKCLNMEEVNTVNIKLCQISEDLEAEVEVAIP